MLLPLLPIVFVFAAQNPPPPSCDEVRRVRAALVALGEDDRAVYRLETQVCRSGDAPVVTNNPVCAQLLILQALGAQGGGNDVDGLVSSVCELGQAVSSMSYWPNGKLAHNGNNVWYWPNGKLAQNGINVWYWPSGKLAQNGNNVWYWPSGNLAQNGATTFYSPDGRIIDEAMFVQLACRDAARCRGLRGQPPALKMAWFLALAGG